MAVNILIVSGSTQPEGRVLAVARVAEEAASAAGARARLLDLHEARLPVFEVDSAEQDAHPAVRAVRESAAWADAFLLGTPEYHGGMSGALKNWFDFLREEPAGKLAAVFAVAGGLGGDMSIADVKTSFQWCHGFTLPFHVAAGRMDFTETALTSEIVHERLRRMAHDLIRYAPPLRRAFAEARTASGDAAGFAGLHR